MPIIKFFKRTEVIAVGCAIVTSLAISLFLNRQQPQIVSVDVMKILNAQRAAVPGILQGEDNTIAILRVGKQIMPVIREVAGQRTLVVIAQALVDPDVPDITGRVLRRLGLPDDAPTLNLTDNFLNAPRTNAELSNQSWDVFQQKQADETEARLKQAQRERAAEALP
ncbi:hypothetical protein [Sinimarinibacterium sp. NLF-5-8]|uniref:hypothetical protein n=1 Tax=Sinimarinibacterium sp. NLF-5-8 TaxID=2698684 RepID=UPI00137BA41D|nr:hypothetical protein [Sinimarinibacterium sp. NLF-5-8]QHS09091.1 hypothetical protein GT972_02285 [Sinimarinibacterium sp. NLF-5-8]